MEAAVVQAAHKGLAMEAEGRARAERTENMYPMSVTLDVSRLSGWLNADASCRVERGTVGGGRHAGKQAGGWGGVVDGANNREAPDCGG